MLQFFSTTNKFLAVFPTQLFTYFFLNMFTHIFSKKQKPITFHEYSICRLKWIAHYFLYFTIFYILHYFTNTKVTFILSFISSSLEFWSGNHTSIYENSKLNVFKNIKVSGEISTIWPNNLLGINVWKNWKLFSNNCFHLYSI